MSELALLFIGAIVGVGAVFLVAYGGDEYRSWKYSYARKKELRERPDIPYEFARLEVFLADETRPSDTYRLVWAYDKDDNRIETNSGEHPRDAIRYLVQQREGKAA